MEGLRVPRVIVQDLLKEMDPDGTELLSEVGGCPIELITDLGTENGLAAALQSFFRDNPEAYRFVASPRNQRIEGTAAEVEFGSQHIIEDLDCPENDHQEYFDYARDSLSIPLPIDWEGALEMCKKLTHVAIHGYNA
ncbi:hypothetical protein P5673_030424 [Acropora cervicornis]|uniref:Uncharacterized protein n=1 Tax=Acropora cervicornis TaxID=6130 RepID=A0AAD9PU80_ACRCE|nr:hypothetical protein P5673_030424 [Acropora cervicornis]